MSHIFGRMRGSHIYGMLFFLVSLCNLIECTQILFRNCLLIQNLILWGVLQFPGLSTFPSGQFDLVVYFFLCPSFYNAKLLPAFLTIILCIFYSKSNYLFCWLYEAFYVFLYCFHLFVIWYDIVSIDRVDIQLSCNPSQSPYTRGSFFLHHMYIYFIMYHSYFNEIRNSSILSYSMTSFMGVLLRNLLMYQN